VKTIFERALDFVPANSVVGLGSGRAAAEFIKLLGARVRNGFAVRGVATSEVSATLAKQAGVPLVSLADSIPLAVTVDGADEVDPCLDLIKGYGRALVREKVVAAASRQLVILVGLKKIVKVLGERGKLPVEVIPFAMPLCQRRLADLDCKPVPYEVDGRLFLTDNGNHILDCAIGPIANPAELEANIRAIPGVVGTGLFLNMADTVLVGDENFTLVEERSRKSQTRSP
jgi:ribose 5-phosphate isomerase A